MEKLLALLPYLDVILSLVAIVAVSVLVPEIVRLVRRVRDERSRRIITAAAKGVYLAVEVLAQRSGSKTVEKLREGLRLLSEELGRDLTVDEERQAKGVFAALAAKTKVSLSLSLEGGGARARPVERR